MSVPASAFAPAKVNLTLHVTGQRSDGYHLLDSLVMFADLGDHLTVRPAPVMSLTVTGPFAQGIPTDDRNLCWRAAQTFGETVGITLDKQLPHPAGIGGGSSDAAAVIRCMEDLFERAFEGNLSDLGADVPVCAVARAAQMSGIGELVSPLTLPALPAVLVNPGIDVPTPSVFRELTNKTNPPMPDIPDRLPDLWDFLATQRNDLEQPAVRLHPRVGDVLNALSATEARLVRMSGSGATCFGLYETRGAAEGAASALAKEHPGWWVRATTLT